ncbi:MAG: DUF4412 domain-containing protein [Crocinitomicaceae bacterium]
MSILSIGMSFAQPKEGYIAYTIDVSSEDPDMAMSVAMFNGSKMELYFDGDKARTELDFGALMSMTTVINSKTDEVIILTGGMMGNNAVLTTSKEMEVDEDVIPESTVTLKKDKKTILGYKCKKAIITGADGNETVYWYTDKISAISTDKTSSISQLPGMPLEYAVDRDGMVMTFIATIIELKLDEAAKASKFSFTIPEGYEKMTYEELSSGMGGN